MTNTSTMINGSTMTKTSTMTKASTATNASTMTNGSSMPNAVVECILSRTASKYYDPSAALSDDQIRELVRIGTTAPTSFHLQNWRFIASSPYARPKPRLGCVRLPGISPPSPKQPLPSSSAASWPIPA